MNLESACLGFADAVVWLFSVRFWLTELSLIASLDTAAVTVYFFHWRIFHAEFAIAPLRNGYIYRESLSGSELSTLRWFHFSTLNGTTVTVRDGLPDVRRSSLCASDVISEAFSSDSSSWLPEAADRCHCHGFLLLINIVDARYINYYWSCWSATNVIGSSPSGITPFCTSDSDKTITQPVHWSHQRYLSIAFFYLPSLYPLQSSWSSAEQKWGCSDE